jgi:hypothetical protein
VIGIGPFADLGNMGIVRSRAVSSDTIFANTRHPGARCISLSCNPGIPGVGPLAVVHAPAARTAAWGCLTNDGAPARNHRAITLSKIMQPNAELGMNGQIGLPQR